MKPELLGANAKKYLYLKMVFSGRSRFRWLWGIFYLSILRFQNSTPSAALRGRERPPIRAAFVSPWWSNALFPHNKRAAGPSKFPQRPAPGVVSARWLWVDSIYFAPTDWKHGCCWDICDRNLIMPLVKLKILVQRILQCRQGAKFLETKREAVHSFRQLAAHTKIKVFGIWNRKVVTHASLADRILEEKRNATPPLPPNSNIRMHISAEIKNVPRLMFCHYRHRYILDKIGDRW